ncbi:DNA starvation/stationary phase protection protein Dps [Polyangium mundeleinium]|uniref:DNA starvation/stationary phase protection protein Dps n=1 Tax=Polyangium mundeleinium TaxID=2995306 RepID=A0ABT5EEV5_9BACT|nr:DNA starvation/stationary phase protection protein Dps [Polyangium mundeleinium]MDC0740344.1 DNA starvation/stationary phase protection protein Dps [Polyangium mundeleinium]
MYASSSHLPESSRVAIVKTLNERLADGLDLHSQIKVAHWNIKGPHFAALHPLFETFATELAAFNDEIAERAVTLGGLAAGTARHVAASSRLPEYPQETTRGLDHVRHLAERFGLYIQGLHASRVISDENRDADTSDLLTNIITTFDKHTWFLLASLEG